MTPECGKAIKNEMKKPLIFALLPELSERQLHAECASDP